MAGIYIHIPFCKQACNYCNFYFSTSLGNKEKFVAALVQEISQTKNYLNGQKIETLYFGGGTPSLLSLNDFHHILTALQQQYDLSGLKEFTIETNPDDLSVAKVKDFMALKPFGFNRFSIGVQSFFSADLLYMNRAHTADEALSSIKRVQDAGFENITIDLIYGTPTMTDEQWLNNLNIAVSLRIPHISSYALTVETKTSLAQKIKKGVLAPVDEQKSATQFELMLNYLAKHNFEQYEISNFVKDEKYALHNTNYWRGVHYLGLGPSAHSFDGKSRRWNVANNLNYINGLMNNTPIHETEILTNVQEVNERIMTGLRTKWGIDLSSFDQETKTHIIEQLNEIDPLHYVLQNQFLTLSNAGKLFADRISATLFMDEM
jgi:oxygen-independent coproporphyrinogen-3 oxidase